jgi:hypothetical protein
VWLLSRTDTYRVVTSDRKRGYNKVILAFVTETYGEGKTSRSCPSHCSQESNSSNYVIYNQTEILDDRNILLPSALEQEGIPFFAGTYARFLLTTNLVVTALVCYRPVRLIHNKIEVDLVRADSRS